MILAGFALFIIFLLVIGMPVAFTLSIAGILGIIQFIDMSTLSQVPVIAYKTLDSYVLTSVPLYILMSQIMLTGKVGSGLFELGSKWMGHLPGGLGIATIFACAIFAAISGSSVATAVTIGAMAIPEMLKRGYDRKLVVGSVAAGGTLGILIPPSIPMILYGTITDESVGKLFMSGVVPGALLTLAFVAYIVIASWNKPREEKASTEEKMKALRDNIWGFCCRSSSSAVSIPAFSRQRKPLLSARSMRSSSHFSSTGAFLSVICRGSSARPSRHPA